MATPKAPRFPDVFKCLIEEKSAIIPASRDPFDRQISIIVSRGRFEVIFKKHGKNKDDETLHPDQQARIERVMHEIEKLSSVIFPKGFGPLPLPLKNPPRGFEPYCILSIQDLQDPPLLESLPIEDAPNPLSLQPPPSAFHLYQDPQYLLIQNIFNSIFANGSLQLNVPFPLHPQNLPINNAQELDVDNRLAIVPSRATSPTNNKPTPLNKSTQTSLSFREIAERPLDPSGWLHEGIEDSKGEEFRKLKEALEKAHQQINELSEQISTDREEKKQLLERLEETAEEIKRLHTDFAKLEESLDQQSEKTTKAEAELMASIIKINTLLEEKNRILEEHSNRLQREIATHALTQQRLRESQALVSEKEMQLERIKQELTKAKGAQSKTSGELEKYTREAEARLQELFEENGVLAKKNTALAQENEQLRLFITNTNKENANLAQENEQLRLFITNTNEENANLAQENEQLRSSLRKIDKMKQPSQQLRMSRLVEISVEPSEGIKESEIIGQSNAQELEELRNALEKAHQQREKAEKESEMLLNQLGEELNTAQLQLDAARKEIAHLNDDAETRLSWIDSVQQKIEEKEAENTSLTIEIALLKEEQKKTKELETQIEHLTRQISENRLIQQRLEETQQRLEETLGLVTQKEEENRHLRETATAYERISREYQEYRESSESLLEEYAQENTDLFTQKARLYAELADIYGRVAEERASTPRRQVFSTPRGQRSRQDLPLHMEQIHLIQLKPLQDVYLFMTTNTTQHLQRLFLIEVKAIQQIHLFKAKAVHMQQIHLLQVKAVHHLQQTHLLQVKTMKTCKHLFYPKGRKPPFDLE
ncbi:MAG: hypothetical protein LVR00_01970 [Rhabdochlamydiaceae bacterium]